MQKQMAMESGDATGRVSGRVLVRRRAPVVIGVLLSLSFYGGLQTLLVMAKNTVTFVPVSAPAQVVRPDLTSPPIRTVRSAPTEPTEVAPQPVRISVGSGASLPELFPVPIPAPAPGPAEEGGTDPVTVSPKPAPVGPPPVETAPVQPPPPIVVVPEAPGPIPAPVTVPPIPVPPVSGGAAVKPPTSIPLSSSSPPSSRPVPPISGAATPTTSIPLEVE
jgi:hypothetical protein